MSWGLQKEEDNIVTLLDDESRAVLGLLQRGSSSAVAPPPVLPLRPSYQSDLTNRPAKVCHTHAATRDGPHMDLVSC